MKLENRERHRWGEEDEYNICSCVVCNILRKKTANATYSGRVKFGAMNKWHFQYSKGGTKWVDEVPPCK